MWRKWTSSRNVIDKDKYDRYAAKCKYAVQAFNAERELDLINCNDLGKFYKFVNMKLSSSMHVPSLESPDDKLITSPLEKANAFNQYFASVFTVDDGRTPVCNLKTDQNCTISDVEFSPRKVYKALRSLKPKHSYGPDGLPSIMLHNLARAVSEPLSFIFDASFRSGALPSCCLMHWLLRF
jgi:hypothetical protein